MAREKAPDPPGDDIPSWVMTFSDVITLLMTFFILLLTFATNEPETFDRMQVALFGGGGASGIAGETEGMDNDAVLMRERSRAGRLSKHGSEMPPIHTDPALESLADGIAGLEKDEERVLATAHRLQMPLSNLVSAEGQLTSVGQQHLRMLAVQMRKRPLELQIVVSDEDRLTDALAIAEHLSVQERLPEASIAAGVASQHVSPGNVLMIVADQGANRGS
jgi:flagellar motor protein MotB